MSVPVSPDDSPRRPAIVLMLGNFVTALAVLGPAAMLNELTAAFDVSVQQAGWLVTSGAVVLCIGSPLMAWATSTIDRRTLLAATLALLALGFAVSALVPSFVALFLVRLPMLFIAAVFTPQAAGTISLITSERHRAGAISFVFLGWSLAVAAGLPLITLVADQLGWRSAFGMLSACAAVACLLTGLVLPRDVRGTALSLQSWGRIARSRPILLLLLLTALFISGQFMIFVYLAPLMSRLAGAGPQAIAGSFAVMGMMGLAGNAMASRVVGTIGPFRTSVLCAISLLAGAVLWALGAGAFVTMAMGVGLLGFGSFALNSMQQARLVATAPELASGTVALNTSLLYVGQATGSWLGGALIARGLPEAIGAASVLFMLASLAVLALTRR